MAGKDFISAMRRRAEEAEGKLREAVEALRFYAEEDRQSVELGILESVDLRPATATLAKIEGERNA